MFSALFIPLIRYAETVLYRKEWRKEEVKQMGSLCSKWWNEKGCISLDDTCGSWRLSVEESDAHSVEKKLQVMEQRMSTLELRINTTEDKWNGMDDRVLQHHGDIRMLNVRCRTMEQRMDTFTFDHCERLDDDIIVVDES